MRSSTRSPWFHLGVLLALLLLPALAAAAPPQWALTGFASFNTYAMSDVNNEISAINFVSSFAGYGTMDKIDTGPSFGGGLRAIFNDRAWVELDYERLLGSSDINFPFGSLKYDVPSHGILASGGYLFPGGTFRFGVGGGLGFYTASGSSIRVTGTLADYAGEVTGDLSGTGLGAHAFGLLDAAMSENVHAEFLAGFRYARTGDVKLSVAGAGEATIPDYKLDWTGAVFRGGLALHFGSKE